MERWGASDMGEAFAEARMPLAMELGVAREMEADAWGAEHRSRTG